MSDPHYAINYNGDTAQTRSPAAHNDNHFGRHDVHYRDLPRQGFAFPSILKTAAVFVAGAAALFAWEVCAPEGYRASTIVGIYDARIAAAVKAAQLQQQAHYDVWAAGVKLSAEQQAEQYKAVTQGVL